MPYDRAHSYQAALVMTATSTAKIPQATFGTLFVPCEDTELIKCLGEEIGWRIVYFRKHKEIYFIFDEQMTHTVDFATNPLPYIDAAAILFTGDAKFQAEELARLMGLNIVLRKCSPSLSLSDRRWLDGLAVHRFGDMLEELHNGQVELGQLRSTIDRLRTNFSLIENYLYQRDTPLLRKIWRSPYRSGRNIDVTTRLVRKLPCSPWGLTRIQLWIVTPAHISDQPLTVKLNTVGCHEALSTWTVTPAQCDYRSGWLSFDLAESLSLFGDALALEIVGKGWQVGGSVPWLIEDDGVKTIDGPAVRVYATLPGTRGPRGLPLPIDDRSRIRLYEHDLSRARAVAIPAGLNFRPVDTTSRGLTVHPVANMVMVAKIEDACPPNACCAILKVYHAHADGDSFLVSLTIGDQIGSDKHDEAEIFDIRLESGVVNEIGPVDVGGWIKVEAGQYASIIFNLNRSTKIQSLQIMTRAASYERTNLAWATVTSVEFVIDDE
ncbi:DUF6212 domain-containing protein [Methylobacterium sp. 17Sr1-1]|uniref:DUF6212 domain-containing protein n=1 Tax=Methylobacterium sp. 17Sr1-1 TaxID=2202826 RepID=UPI0013A54DB0|nr:DUF6212 domain-containing protein [Methylobacterium sp. 17Sr1-1]